MFSYVVRQAICILNVCFVYGAAMLSPGRQRVTLSTSEGLSAARQLGGRLPEHGGTLVYQRQVLRGLASMCFLKLGYIGLFPLTLVIFMVGRLLSVYFICREVVGYYLSYYIVGLADMISHPPLFVQFYRLLV